MPKPDIESIIMDGDELVNQDEIQDENQDGTQDENQDGIQDETQDEKKNEKREVEYDEQFKIELEKNMIIFEEQIFKNMTMIRYKYEYYEFISLIINITIIFCSSVITFLESLRANITPNENLNFWFTIITLSLGFMIAISLSFYKFSKIQDKMETTKAGLIGLEAPYKELCEFMNESQTYFALKIYFGKRDKNTRESEIGVDKTNPYGSFRNNKELAMKWEKIRIKSVYPTMNADNIIKSGEYCNYEKRFMQQLAITLKQRQKMDLQKLAYDNLVAAKEMIISEMLQDTNHFYNKYGNVKEMKRGNDLKLEYWNEGVIMTNKLQERYNKLLGVKTYDKCCDTWVDVYCCCCPRWCKKFVRSIIYLFKCCCPSCCFQKEIRQHENFETTNINHCCWKSRKTKNQLAENVSQLKIDID